MDVLIYIFNILSTSTAATIAAWFTAAIALFALVGERRRFRLSQSVALLLKFEDRFDSDRIRGIRIKAARGIARNNLDEVDDVLDQFETIDLLVEKGVLDEEMVWCSFGYWLLMYMYTTENYIKESQAEDPTTWTYFLSLSKRVKEIENSMHGTLKSKPSKEDIQNFIKSESNLDKAKLKIKKRKR